MGRLDRKVALITGVSSGIGNASAQLFAQEGACVFGVDLDADGGRAIAETLHQRSHICQFFAADLTQDDQLESAVRECVKAFGRIDILYNNAGISSVQPFPEVSRTSLEHIFAINVFAIYRLCQLVIPYMQAQGGGVIINTASELSMVAQPLFTAYCATKGAVLSFTRALALEYARHNIRINTLCPGPIDTPMLQHEFATESNPEKAQMESIESIPIGRLGNAQEIAQVALFLASEAPPLMHGSSIVVDGGKTLL
ncbi:MAG TPA: SDR family NAD(P)-dependent oxidoreductase [Elainellaceae cyanobacterium]